MKKYKPYNNSTQYNTPGFTIPKQIERVNKHRDEIIEYFETYDENLSLQESTVNGESVITFSFTPIPQELAAKIVNSKTVFFNVIRNKVCKRKRSRYYKGKHKRSLNKIQTVFWDFFDFNKPHDRANDNQPPIVSIPNTPQDQFNRPITVEELTRGYIVRNVEYLKHFNIGRQSFKHHAYYYNDEDNYENVDEPKYDNRYYIGLIYYNARNIPEEFKMCEYECEMIYN